jgi:PHP family Zn ribbon phosphoesterase
MKLDRTCYKCGTDFKLKATEKSSNICSKCKTAYQRAYARRKVAETPEEERYKDLYPYNANEKMVRFRKIRNQLDKMKDREEWKQFFKQKLIDMEKNEADLLIWIYDRRDQETKEDKVTLPRSKSEYEDTRTIQQNKSWFD